MKSVTVVLLVLCLASIQTFSQTPQTSISGSVLDDKNKPLEAATISVLKATDA